MSAGKFRQIALGLANSVESAHMRHPDFRVNGKIFATLGYPDSEWGMVKLTPPQQEEFLQAEPNAFRPVKGAWGQRGCTGVYLRAAKVAPLRDAMTTA